MPSLGRTLQDHDLGHLRIIAELWGLEMPPGRARDAAAPLGRRMLDSGEAEEVLAALPRSARNALEDLLSEGGRAPLTELQLRHGPLSRPGPGRRDRERPWLDRQAALDALWYRGLIGLGFFETPTGPREYAFVPDEFLARLRLAPIAATPPVVYEPVRVVAGGGAADDAVTLLAALRRRPSKADPLPPARTEALRPFLIHPASPGFLLPLLRAIGALTAVPLRPEPELVRDLILAGRSAILDRLHKSWFDSAEYNDLSHVSGLKAPMGRWPNDPVLGRRALVELTQEWSSGAWYDLEAFIAGVRERRPSFLRPAGDFDSWYLRDASSGRFLRGVEDWEAVDGGYLRFCLTGPLHWLGVLDLEAPAEDDRPRRIRLRRAIQPAEPSLEAALPPDEGPPARLAFDGRMAFPPGASLAHRYQVARFAEWERADASGYTYRITPRALTTAAAQRLDVPRVVTLLESATRGEIPDPLVRSLAAWSKRGTQAALEGAILIRTKDASELRRLRSDPATARYLVEVLSPTVARIQARDREKLLQAAARRGMLIDPPEEQP